MGLLPPPPLVLRIWPKSASFSGDIAPLISNLCSEVQQTSLDESTGPALAHEVRYPGGDCTSDIWIDVYDDSVPGLKPKKLPGQ